jgi:hypothetical protein
LDDSEFYRSSSVSLHQTWRPTPFWKFSK